MWSREKIGKAAQEIADHLALIENVKALQVGQKEIANAVAALGSRIGSIEGELRAMRAEIKLEALKETQQMLNSVQGAFHEKLTDITVRVSRIEGADGAATAPLIALSKTAQKKLDGESPSS